jgi:hypothetical protein
LSREADEVGEQNVSGMKHVRVSAVKHRPNAGLLSVNA